MKQITENIYLFSELSEKAQDRAIADYLANDLPDMLEDDYFTDWLKEIAEKRGYTDVEITLSDGVVMTCHSQPVDLPFPVIPSNVSINGRGGWEYDNDGDNDYPCQAGNDEYQEAWEFIKGLNKKYAEMVDAYYSDENARAYLSDNEDDYYYADGERYYGEVPE